MSRLKFYLTLLLARLVSLAIKVLNRSSGTSFVGLMILKFYPDFLKDCQKYINGEIITVTGTNGKTTTSSIITQILENAGKTPVHNAKGANMLTGIVNVCARTIRPFKRFDCAVFESDEAYLSKLYDFIKADYLLVTNLFRDQLDRYGELDTTAKKIQEAIDKNPDLKLILNADDPLVANFNTNHNTVYFGFEDVEFASETYTSKAPSELFHCKCGNVLKYNKRFFAHEGHYYCDCGYSRPQPQYNAKATIYDDKIGLEIKHENKVYNFEFNSIGLYNAYNALGAIALCLENGIDTESIQTALSGYKTIFGRAEKTVLNGHDTLIQLIKNPTGASEVLKTVNKDSNLLIAINDNYADGRDVSWLWDAEFEALADIQKDIIVSGIRANDMALRLKYAGVPEDKIKVITPLKDAIEYISTKTETGSSITILPTYTVLLEMNKRGK